MWLVHLGSRRINVRERPQDPNLANLAAYAFGTPEIPLLGLGWPKRKTSFVDLCVCGFLVNPSVANKGPTW